MLSGNKKSGTYTQNVCYLILADSYISTYLAKYFSKQNKSQILILSPEIFQKIYLGY